MDVGERKKSLNGSTGHGEDCRTGDKPPVKATVLQKDVSESVFLRTSLIPWSRSSVPF